MKKTFLMHSTIPLAILTSLLVVGTGCKTQPPAEQTAAQPASTPAPTAARDDQQIGLDIQAKIGAESALQGQDIQVAVANGVATLNGKVDNDASRALASADSASIDGVKTVVNNLVVAPAKAAKVAPPPPPRPERKRREVAQAMPPSLECLSTARARDQSRTAAPSRSAEPPESRRTSWPSRSF